AVGLQARPDVEVQQAVGGDAGRGQAPGAGDGAVVLAPEQARLQLRRSQRLRGREEAMGLGHGREAPFEARAARAVPVPRQPAEEAPAVPGARVVPARQGAAAVLQQVRAAEPAPVRPLERVVLVVKELRRDEHVDLLSWAALLPLPGRLLLDRGAGPRSN